MTQLNLIGQTLGDFQIETELGRGGMAVVYRARQITLDRIVALKVLPPELSYDTNYITRFRHEARSVARLEHPHIVPIFEIGESQNLHYIAMKYVEGRTLKELVRAEGSLPLQRVVDLLSQVAQALDYAHRLGVIHRDIKPSNIMVTNEGWVYLTDFGLARGVGGSTGLTMTGTVMGTPEYMSPEQAQGVSNIGPATDIYALGVVLYELLTGAFPFQADTPMAMLAARLLQTPRPPRDVRGDLPMPVEDVIMRALARNPDARYDSASALVAALRSATGISAQTPVQPPVSPPRGTAPPPTVVDHAPARQQQSQPGRTPTSPTPPLVMPANTGPTVATSTPQARVAAGTPPPFPHQPTQSTTPTTRPTSRSGLWLGIGGGALAVALVIVGIIVLGAGNGPAPGPTAIPPTTVVDAPPTEIEKLLTVGNEALERPGGMDEAIEAYRQALELAPGNADALTRLALAYNLRGDWHQAEQYARELIEVSGGKGYNAALGHTLLADAIGSLGDNFTARQEAQQAIDLAPDLPLAHGIYSNVLANLAVEHNDDALLNEALASAQTALDTLGDAPREIEALVRNSVGYTYGRQHDLTDDTGALERGKDQFSQAIALQNHIALFHSNLGYFYIDQGEYDLAREKFEKALDVDPAFAHAQTGIGWTYYHEDDTDEAIRAFEAAIELAPDDAGSHFGIGRIFYDKDRYDEAIEKFTEASDRNRRESNYQTWIGEAYLFKGYYADDPDVEEAAYDEAERAYYAALEINNESTFAMTGLGWILQYQERYNDSILWFEKSLGINEEQSEAHNGLGWSLFNVERYGDAAPHFRRAGELDDTYVNSFYGLGRTLEEMGRIGDARAAYEQALELDPDYDRARDALERLE